MNQDRKYSSTYMPQALEPGKQYVATVYADARDADYRTNPEAYVISRRKVTSKSSLKMYMAPGGGFAVSIREIAR